MSKYKLPETKEMIHILEIFLEDRPDIEKLDSAESASHTARYCNDAGDIVAHCHFDWTLAAGLGAALSRIPSGAAEEMAADKELTKTASDNLYEFMNMFSSMYMNDDTDHLKLTEVVETGGDAATLGDGSLKSHYSIDLGNYGKGTLVFEAAAS